MSDLSNKSLIQLAQHSAIIETALAEAEGEFTPQIEQLLAELDVTLPEKVENYALIMDRFEMLSGFYRERVNLLQRMSLAALRVVAKCEENLKIAMETMKVDEIKGVDVKFKLVATPGKVIIENESEIDSGYTVIEQVKKIEKRKIAEDLKLGVPVRGARLEVGKALRRYANIPGKS